MPTLHAHASFARCVTFTLPDGREITVKVVGEEERALVDRVFLLEALNQSGVVVTAPPAKKARS